MFSHPGPLCESCHVHSANRQRVSVFLLATMWKFQLGHIKVIFWSKKKCHGGSDWSEQSQFEVFGVLCASSWLTVFVSAQDVSFSCC